MDRSIYGYGGYHFMFDWHLTERIRRYVVKQAEATPEIVFAGKRCVASLCSVSLTEFMLLLGFVMSTKRVLTDRFEYDCFS